MNRRQFLCVASLGGAVIPEVLDVLRRESLPFHPVDLNCMLGPSNRVKSAYARAEELKADLDYYGPNGAVVYHSYARFVDVKQGNQMILQIAHLDPRVHPCWVIFPSPTVLPDPEGLVHEVRSAGVRAFRILPGERDPNSADLSAREWNFGPLFAALEKHRVPLLIECQLLSWDDLEKLAGKHTNLPVVSLGTTYGESRHVYTFLTCHKSIYFGLG
jgi:hypothetical protein